jgi:tight adherence protein B
VSIALGVLFGIGVLLTTSPWLWPGRHRGARRPGRLSDLLAQVGLARVSVTTFWVTSAILGATAGGLAAATVSVVMLDVAATLVGAALPFLLLVARSRAARRSARIVWPDVVDHLVSAVRSGLALPDSVAALSRTGPPSTRAAFARFEADYRSTGDFAASIDRLKGSLADPVADRLFETLRMSREVGGTELTTVLRALAGYLRADAAVRAEVEARQSWVVVAARLGVAAPWIVLVLLATRPEAANAYNSPAGAVLVAVGLAVTVVAYRLMLVVGRLPEERRWFQ